MSIQKKTTPVPATTREYTESVSCELCRAVFKRATDDNSEIEWLGNDCCGDVAYTNVGIGEGYSYPECHKLIFRDYHVCPECFKTKLEPWLKAQGAVPALRELGW